MVAGITVSGRTNRYFEPSGVLEIGISVTRGRVTPHLGNIMPHTEVFFTPPELIDSAAGILRISGQEAHHIRTVLRHGSGDKITVVDGQGKAYWVTITLNRKGTITGTIDRVEAGWGESKTCIRVIVPPLKGQRMDTVIEKGTELGVSWFGIPKTQNSVVPVTANKLDRWGRIALAAMKQCCRSLCPTIQSFPTLEESLTIAELRGAIILYADLGKPELWRKGQLEGLLRFPRVKARGKARNDRGQLQDSQGIRVAVAVGPEGGFSDDEIALLDKWGAIPFGLGARRLRSDTAVIAALAQIVWLSGEES